MNDADVGAGQGGAPPPMGMPPPMVMPGFVTMDTDIGSAVTTGPRPGIDATMPGAILPTMLTGTDTAMYGPWRLVLETGIKGPPGLRVRIGVGIGTE